jgi:hypothetical protein
MYLVHSARQSIFEIEYIEEVLLSKFKKINRITFDDFLKLDNTENIILYYSDHEAATTKEINDFLSKIQNNYFIIHISDENFNHGYEVYKKALYVFRGYYNPKLLSNNIFTIPIGFQNGFLDNFDSKPKLKLRNIVWSFCGQFYSERINMIDTLSKITPNKTYKVDSFMHKKALDVEKLIEIYSETIFIPCPYGFSNPDSFRVMEALETGCIPIVKKFYFIDYFKLIFGNHPFVVVKKWEDSIKIINHYVENTAELETKQIEVQEWYSNFKLDLSNDVHSVLTGKETNFKSSQKNYQINASRSVLVFLSFFYHFSIRINNYFIKINKVVYKCKQLIKRKLKW